MGTNGYKRLTYGSGHIAMLTCDMARSANYGRTYVSFDWAMKRLLRNKASYVILEGFLSELLGYDIKVNSLLESESNAETETDKTNRVDLLCENQQQELIIIEVQFHSELDYFQRMLFGTSKLITAYLTRGAAYSHVRKIYSVNILYFDLGQGADYIYHGLLHFKGLHLKDELRLSKSQRERFDREWAGELYPEYFILKINNFDKIAVNSLDEWIYYLKTSELPEKFTAKGLTEVENQLKIDTMPAEAKAKYLKHLEEFKITESMLETSYVEGKTEGRDLGIEIGKDLGIESGRQAEKINIIVKAFAQEIPISTIAKLVSLPETAVVQLLTDQGLLKG